MTLPPLWPHQQEAIQRAGDKFALFFDPGCGKTRTAIEIRKQRAPLETKTIILAPLNVCRNWEKELRVYFGHKHNVYLVAGQTKAAKIKVLEKFVQYAGDTPTFLICNIECMRSAEYLSLMINSEATFLIVDESHTCLEAETLIATPSGERQIQHLSVGQAVYCISNYGIDIGRITRKYRGDGREAKRKIHLSCGTTLEGLDSHVIRTPLGWKKLGELQISDPVSVVQEDIRSKLSITHSPQILQRKMFWAKLKSQFRRCGEDVGEESDEKGSMSQQSQRGIEENRASAENSWRQWKADAHSSKNCTTLVQRNFQRIQGQGRVRGTYQRFSKWFSKLLQNRRSYTGIEDWFRNRWEFSSDSDTETTRFEENKEVGVSWVANIEVQKSGSPENSRKSYYDLEIDKFHNYIANGVIVHNCKNPDSKQTKGLLALNESLKPKNLYLLTGTPAPQGEIDLYTTFTLLERNTKSFFVWRRENFFDKNERRRGTQNYWPDYHVTERSRITFQRLLSEISIVARKSEVLKLPPMIYTTLYHELSKDQRKHYETMLQYLFAIDETGNELNAGNFLARNLRLQQILAGHLGDVRISDNSRLKVLNEAIDKVGDGSFIIWTIFKNTYAEIAELLDKRGISFGFLTGEQSASERHDAMNAFEDGALKCLVAHPRAGGVGVNLVKASYSIFYLRNYSLTDYLQAQARNYRGGSEQHDVITQIDIVAANTIDEEIVEALRQKESIQEFILRVKKEYSDGRLS